jgi:hypothetical protein
MSVGDGLYISESIHGPLFWGALVFGRRKKRSYHVLVTLRSAPPGSNALSGKTTTDVSISNQDPRVETACAWTVGRWADRYRITVLSRFNTGRVDAASHMRSIHDSGTTI